MRGSAWSSANRSPVALTFVVMPLNHALPSGHLYRTGSCTTYRAARRVSAERKGVSGTFPVSFSEFSSTSNAGAPVGLGVMFVAGVRGPSGPRCRAIGDARTSSGDGSRGIEAAALERSIRAATHTTEHETARRHVACTADSAALRSRLASPEL